MEPNTTQPAAQPKKRNILLINAIIIVIIGLVIGGTVWYREGKDDGFCFTFKHDTVFGDRTIPNPSNTGYMAPNGMMYYLPEVPALHAAFEREGFYIDPLEKTGGRIYYAAFYGPSTGVALREFQTKYKLGTTGIVENSTIDKLNELYGCPAGVTSPLLMPDEIVSATWTASTTQQ